MNQLTETFTFIFPDPSKQNYATCKSFLYAGSEWFVGLYPSEMSATEREDVQQRGGTACSAVNTDIKYSISGPQKQTYVKLDLNGKCALLYDRSWRTETFSTTTLYTNINLKLTMTRTVCNIATGTLADDLTAIGDKAEQSDVNIIVSDGSNISAYKLFLMMRSSVFQRMFSNPMSESSTNTITIEDVEPAAVRAFVRFTYTDQLNPCCVSLCMQLYRMAHKYEVQGLKIQCTQHLHQLLRDENVIDILLLGELYCASDLCDCALTYISEHAATLATSADFARRVRSYLSDDHLSGVVNTASSEMSTADAQAPASTLLTATNPPTTSTSTSATSSTSAFSPSQCGVALLSSLAGISPGINQHPHLHLTEQRVAGPQLFKCEHCMSV